MSEKYTRIRLPGQKDFSGLLELDEVSASFAVAAARRYASYLRKIVEAIEAAEDRDFQIDLVRGNYVQHHLREIQKATVRAPDEELVQ